jgi:hypothetical protein
MGSFKCPARNSVGPMMIGILVGGLVARVEIGMRWCIKLEFITDERGGNHLYI